MGRWKLALKRFATRVGHAQSVLLLSLVYLLLWVPLGWMARWFTDWLKVRPEQNSHWWPRAARVNDPAHLRDPF